MLRAKSGWVLQNSADWAMISVPLRAETEVARPIANLNHFHPDSCGVLQADLGRFRAGFKFACWQAAFQQGF